MVKLTYDNREIRITGASLDLTDKLKAATSYPVAGAHFSAAYRSKRWDGRQHLVKLNKGGFLVAPIGLLPDIRKVLEKEGIQAKYVNKAPPPEKNKLVWNPDVVLRDYQGEAIRAFVSGPSPGRGILKMPIRSGKTKTAAGLIYVLGVRAIFVVPSLMLLNQTAESLAECFPKADIGRIGDGEWREGADITVATVQTLSKNRGKPHYKKLAASYGLAIFDEAHHLKSDSGHEVMLDIDARYRLGLSATVYLDSKKENERGAIWLKASTGDIKYEVDMSMLIERGFLVRQNVKMIHIDKPDLKKRGWSNEMRNLALYENEVRNQAIINICLEAVERERVTMIISSRMNQIAILTRMLHKAHLSHVVVTGKSTSVARQRMMASIKNGTCYIVMGSVFGEGVDVPEVEVLVNAEGGQDIKSTIQRMRNMTPAPGKSEATLYDFYDRTNDYLTKHSRARLKVYKSIKAFNIEYIGDWPLSARGITRKRETK